MIFEPALAESGRANGRVWEALGPFPSGMREHPFLASALHAYSGPAKGSKLPVGESEQDTDVRFARQAYDEGWSIPSDLAIGGRVGWKRFRADEDGWVDVRYPEIRWDQLRAEHGWAALQYSCILRTTITVPPPRKHSAVGSRPSPVAMRIDAHQVVEYAFIPSFGPVTLLLTWYQGDIYDYASSQSGTSAVQNGAVSNLARSISLPEGKYVLLVRARYEIRMFGDPAPDPPVIRFKMDVQLDELGAEDAAAVELVEGLCVLPDVVDGWLMGDWVSVPLRATPRMESASLSSACCTVDGVDVRMPKKGRRWTVRGGQTRPIALRVQQIKPLDQTLDALEIVMTLDTGGETVKLRWSPTLTHRTLRKPSPFLITFPYPSEPPPGSLPALVSFAMVVPPKQPLPALPSAPAQDALRRLPSVMLGLHGAGVDVRNPFWHDAIPDRPGGWTVLPQGKTEWGEDWHGGSMDDAWAARGALGRLAKDKLGIEVSDETLLAGHSNGGQGAWHLAARYPDRVSGVIAASGWATIQDYVPYTGWASRHYTDPSLVGILSSSLAPYANDVHLCNLTHIPVLAVHGAEDDNVPPRHGRSMTNALIAYSKGDESNVRYIEVPKKGHWWTEVLKSDAVLAWIDALPRKESASAQLERGFEVTVVNPDESGGRAGVRILEVDVPGRVVGSTSGLVPDTSSYEVKPRNVRRAILPNGAECRWDGGSRCLSPLRTPEDSLPRRYGPMIRILATSGPLRIVHGNTVRQLDLALRIAHDVYLNHRIDVEILNATQYLEALQDEAAGGNVVVLGRPKDNLAMRHILALEGPKPPVSFIDIDKGALKFGEEVYDEPGAGIISLWPSPSGDKSLALIIVGNDNPGLERAARLFPIRTGVPVPDWVIVGAEMDRRGAGGILGAGFWANDWGLSDQMTWSQS